MVDSRELNTRVFACAALFDCAALVIPYSLCSPPPSITPHTFIHLRLQL